MSSASWDDLNVPAKPRTSIDTLMDRLGVLEIKDEQPRKTHQRRRPNQSSSGEKRRPRPKRTFCCFEIVDDNSDDDYRPSRPSQRPVQRRPKHPPTSFQRRPSPIPAERTQYTHGQRISSASQAPSPQFLPTTRKTSTSSHSQSLLSWIPPALSPETTSLLLTELAKPISHADEAGYIYMCWATPQNTATTRNNPQSPSPKDIAPSLLPQASPRNNNLRPAPQPRTVSDAIRAARDLNALTSNPTPTTPGAIRLKIGRTSNVHRRLTEWTRQCSYDLSLIRYYPYTPSASASASAPSSPVRSPLARRDMRSDCQNTVPGAYPIPGRKVPHVHRVERLIHLELAGLRVRDLGRCSECGKEHREWFEIEAAKEALRRVDDCIRRWVAWGESMG